MAEVIERVAKLEERFDGVTAALAEVKAEIRDLRAEFRAELQGGLSGIRAEMQGGFGALRAEIHAESANLRAEMQTQFRWLLGGLGGVVLAVLVAIATGAFGR